MERQIADRELKEMNKAIKPDLRAKWELTTAMRRMNLRRRPPGKPPVWKFIKAKGKLIREGKAGGIN